MRYLPDDNLSYPILIILDNGSAGSGFLLNYKNTSAYIITARHVLYDNTKKKDSDPDVFQLKTNKFRLLTYVHEINNLTPKIYEVDLKQAASTDILFSDKYDVAIIKIGTLTKQPNTSQMSLSLTKSIKLIQDSPGSLVTVHDSKFKKFEDVLVSNEIFLFGYPVSLGQNIEPNRPLLRKGIVAGKNMSNRTIILDCPVYQGNSGGLVIQVEEANGVRNFYPIGIVSAFVPFIEVFQSLHFGYKNQSFENSGYSIVTPIDVILDLISTPKPVASPVVL